MAHFAQVKNNIVQQVIVAEQNFIDTLPDSSDWVQTSYNTRGGVHFEPNTNQPDGGIALRYNYAGIGYNYDGIGFYSPKPYESWILDTTTYTWQAPIPYPTDENFYIWNEETTMWIAGNTNNT
jgi:hypothetical protein